MLEKKYCKSQFLIFCCSQFILSSSIFLCQATEDSMATTLGLLKFPILAQKKNTPFIHSKMPLLSNSSKLDVCKKDSHSPRKLFTEIIQHLSSASLSPASLALPFFLDTKASPSSSSFRNPLLL
jgi:hypothetical protein